MKAFNESNFFKVINKILAIFNLEIVTEYYYDFNVYSVCRKVKK